MKNVHPQHKKYRRLVLLDIENLAGNGMVSSQTALQLVSSLNELCSIDVRDIVFVGSHKGNMRSCSLVALMLHGMPCFQNGPDGAELALLRRAVEVTPAAYESDVCPIRECVIGSGDHKFIEHALLQRRRGNIVTVVARPKSLSLKLAEVAHRVIYLDGSEIESRKAA
jgi:hypothetical protein